MIGYVEKSPTKPNSTPTHSIHLFKKDKLIDSIKKEKVKDEMEGELMELRLVIPHITHNHEIKEILEFLYGVGSRNKPLIPFHFINGREQLGNQASRQRQQNQQSI